MNSTKLTRPFVLGAVLTAALGILPSTNAGSTKEITPPIIESPASKDWELRLTIPGWLASIEGDTGVLGVAVDADTSFSTILDELDMSLALSVDFRYKRMLFVADGLYSEVSVSAEPTGFAGRLFKNATLDVKQGMAEGYLGYRVVETDALDLDLFAGVRYNYYELTIKLEGTELRSPRTGRELALTRDREASGTHEWVDPLVATRITWHITKPIALILSGDIGGFGVSSDITWQAYAGLRADLTRCLWVEAGYRHQKTDYTDGGFIYDAALTGPQILLGLRF